jgi:hypothetical protein
MYSSLGGSGLRQAAMNLGCDGVGKHVGDRTHQLVLQLGQRLVLEPPVITAKAGEKPLAIIVS